MSTEKNSLDSRCLTRGWSSTALGNRAAISTCGALRRIGDDITKTLRYVPGRFKVIRHMREAVCRACDTLIAAPAPDDAPFFYSADREGKHQRTQLRGI